MSVLLVLTTFLVGIYFPSWLGKVITYFQNRKILKEITPREATPDRLCKTQHAWMTAQTYTDKGPGTTQICRMCGLISGTNKLASHEAIDRIEENNKVRAMEDKFYKDFTEKEYDTIKKFMDEEMGAGVVFEKLAAIHTAGMTFGTRYGLYKSVRNKEIEKELNRSDA